MNCLIVDDDPITRMEIEFLVKKVPFLQLIASASSAVEAFNILNSEKTDLVFLDVLMPDMTGLQLMEAVKENLPQVILMTTEKNYAVDAFNYNVTDFLVKPVSEDRFLKAVAKAKANAHQVHRESSANYVLLRLDISHLEKVNLNDILYIESLGDYINFYTSTKRLVIKSKISSVLAKLPSSEFMLVHKSFIVRLDKITGIEDNSILINKAIIPLSRNYRKELIARLNLI